MNFLNTATFSVYVVIVRFNRTIQFFLDSPIKSGNDDKSERMYGLINRQFA